MTHPYLNYDSKNNPTAISVLIALESIVDEVPTRDRHAIIKALTNVYDSRGYNKIKRKIKKEMKAWNIEYENAN